MQNSEYRRRGRKYVGRASLLAEVDDTLAALLDGRGGLILVSGEPGIGKSRTMIEFNDRALRAGAGVAWGICHEQEGLPAYWPWIQIVRNISNTHPPGHQNPSAPLVRLLSLATDPGAGVPYGMALQDRMGLFNEVLQLLVFASQKTPLVLIIDNLQNADAASLRLLEFLAPFTQSSRLLIIASHRDPYLAAGSSLGEHLSRLIETPLLVRARLKGLEPSEAAELIRQETGWDLEQGIVLSLCAQTQGNPLFLLEIARNLPDHLARPGPERGVSGETIPLPDGIRMTIRKRLSQLSSPCQELLRVASVLGRSFDEETLLALAANSGIEDTRIFIEEAILANVLTASSAPDRQMSFVHALFREALLEELSEEDKALLNARAVNVLESFSHRRDPEHLARLAHHAICARRVIGTEQALQHVMAAARHSMRATAYEDAICLLRQALHAYEKVDAAFTGDFTQLKLLLGEAQMRAGEIMLSLETFREVLKQAEHAADIEGFAEAAIAFEGARWQPGLPSDESIRYLRKALQHLPDDKDRLRALLLSGLSRALSHSQNAEAAISVGEEAIDVARRTNDRMLLCHALEHGAMAMARDPSRLEQRLRLNREHLEIADEVDLDEMKAVACACASFTFLQAARMEEWRAQLEKFEYLADCMRQPHFDYQLAQARTTQATLQGDFPAAQRHCLVALGIGRKIQGADAEGVFALQMFILSRERGELSALRPVLSAILKGAGESGLWQPGLALLHAELGDTAQASQIYQDLAARGFADLPRDDLWLVNLAFLADIAALTGQSAGAGILLELLTPFRNQTIVTGPSSICLGPVARCLGNLAALQSRFSQAFELFSLAEKLAGQLASAPLACRIRSDRITALILEGAPSSLRRASEEIGKLKAETSRLGMKSLFERASAQAMLLERRIRDSGFDSLTPREIDVLRLIAQGLSNKSIMAQLRISHATVATHVRNILDKTGCANRTAAAAYARTHNLLG